MGGIICDGAWYEAIRCDGAWCEGFLEGSVPAGAGVVT